MTFAIKLTGACSDTSLPTLERDQLLSGDNNGVKFLFDMAFPFSYSGGTPVNGSTVADVSETTTPATVSLQSGETLSYAGGGFDQAAWTKGGNCLSMPASVAANIWATTNQYFIVCLYLKLPTLAHWNTSASVAAMLQWSNTSYLSGSDLLVIGQQSSNSQITFRRQKAAASVDIIAIIPHASDYGSVVQLAFWRDATGQYARFKSANGTVLGSAAVGTNNTQNFSALTGKIGNKSDLTNSEGVTLQTGMTNAYKSRLYRGFVENLETSGRSAATVLDADYTRTVARGVFS